MVAMNVHLVKETVRLSSGVICHILNEAGIILVTKSSVEYDENDVAIVLVAILCCLRCFFCHLTHVSNLRVVLGEHQRKVEVAGTCIAFCFLDGILQQSIVACFGIEMESKRTDILLDEFLVYVGRCGIAEIQHFRDKAVLRCIGGEGLFQFLNLMRWESRELYREDAAWGALDYALVVKPVEHLVQIIFILSSYEQIADVVFGWGDKVIVVVTCNIVEGVQKKNSFENGKGRTAMLLNMCSVGVEALRYSTIVNDIILEHFHYEVPKIIGCDCLAVGKSCLAGEETFHRLILPDKLEYAST